MVEARNLAYKDRFVRYLIQTLSDRFDTLSTIQPLPFVDQTSRIPLVYRVNQTEYTQILSAIMTGGDLAFPSIAHELELIWTNPDGYGVSEDFCLDYENADSSMINFYPQDPHTQPDLVPSGYLLPPFWVFGDVLPIDIGSWFDDLLEDITGYLPTDVLTTIGSFPILGSWDDLVGANLPRIDIDVTGKGILELHLLSIPFGGRALITLDTIPNILDIVAGLWLESDWLVDLDRDYTSIPPESLEVMIVEFPVETTGAHTVHVTLLPVVNDSLVPLSYGGGIRKITWCPDEIPDEPIGDCDITTLLADNVFFTDEYVPAIFGEYYAETVANETAQAAIYDNTPQSIGVDIPVSVPNATEKNALCGAVSRFVSLYASTKLCLIQSKNFFEVFWTNLANAINDMYNAVTNLMSPIYSPNIYSCFIDDVTAITALQDVDAIEELACYIYDELKTVTMSETAFNDAVSNASTDLTGNSQDIACLMQNDNNLSLYINMLEAYQIALTQLSNSQDVSCPCESDTYWMKVWDFANGAQGWTGLVTSSTLVTGFVGSAFQDIAGGAAWCIIKKDLGGSFIIKAAAMKTDVDGYTGNGQDAIRMSGRQGVELSGTEYITRTASFITQATHAAQLGIWEQLDLLEVGISQSYVFQVQNAGARSGSNYARISKVVLYGLPDGVLKPVGSVWVNSIPSSPASLFP